MSHFRWFSNRFVHVAVCVGALIGVIGAGHAVALRTFAIPSYSIPLNGAASATVTLDQASAGVVVVSLSSSNPRVAGVQSGIPFQPRSTSGTTVVSGAGPGCAKVSATLGSRTIPQYVVVHPATTATTLNVTVPNNLLPPGAVGRGSVTLASSLVTSATITSNNAATATVPASIPLTRGSGSFAITAGRVGCAFITVTAASQSVQKVVQVIDIGS